MEIGTEISRKIRTAIKGKLLELGAYVDEELPDYIMVMVANKKTQDQMTDDLSLFLGNNTTRFTTWLQGVLDKLRTVTPGSNSLKASEAIIFNSSMPPLKSQSREDSGREAPPQRQETYHSGAPSSSSDRVSAEAALAARLTSAVKPLQESSLSEAVIDIKLDLDDSFNDDFAPESSLYSRRKPADLGKTQRPSAQIYRPPGSVQSSYRAEEHSSAQRPPPSSGNAPQPPSAYSSIRVIGTTRPYDAREAIRSAESYRSAMSSERAARELESSRKRRMPVASSVVKVKRFTDDYLDEDEEEEEEEEEGYTSRVSGLTSSVSVPTRPERRPTLPPSKQANKNLILKAISEAQESITKTTSYSTVPPKQTVPVAPRARQIPEEELIVMKSRMSMLRYQEESEEATAVPDVVVDSRQAEERKLDILSRLQPEPMDVDQAWGQESGEGQNLRPVDSRSFILKTSKYSQNAPGQTPPTTDASLQNSRHIQPRDNPVPEKPPSPKFIVTLEGVPSPQGYRSDEDMEESMVYTEEGETYPSQYNPHRSEQSDPNPTSQDGLSTGETAAPPKTKIPERCKYWPACKNGRQCAYHHPTTLCKAFPKCRFADKCFFIHPNCKYDAKCTKTDCPFTHASRRGTAPPPPAKPASATAAMVKPTKVFCRFFPACKNTECTFFHPKHCRFSSHCTRPDCEFYHPKIAVPPRHALTWTRAQASE
ncbi:zinc finger CCCH domain-containing protein 14 isoform X2 [Hyperolius riggenbachi]|uniref:zinc finger CCCH domain-containing protein 14 isoform X2 n=1 Tax=Hyperolius riggenbachi TaxID=752182 RepID=UPI0035A2E832